MSSIKERQEKNKRTKQTTNKQNIQNKTKQNKDKDKNKKYKQQKRQIGKGKKGERQDAAEAAMPGQSETAEKSPTVHDSQVPVKVIHPGRMPRREKGNNSRILRKEQGGEENRMHRGGMMCREWLGFSALVKKGKRIASRGCSRSYKNEFTETLKNSTVACVCKWPCRSVAPTRGGRSSHCRC